jgi:acyl-CoA hydrolase
MLEAKSMHDAYRAKHRTASEAASLLRSRDLLCLPLGPGQPAALLEALGARDDFEDLSIFCALLLAPHAVLFKPGVRVLSGFYGPVERAIRAQGGNVEFIPADFRRYAPAMRKMSPRVMATIVAPPDANGRMSLALHAGASVDELHRAGADPDRLLIAEVNPRLPRTLGIEPEHTNCLTLEEVDVIVESDLAPPTLPESDPTDVERAIAEQIRAFVTDGATLQTGIGGIPSTVVEILAAAEGGDYGIHSEMFTTGLMKLHEAGKITNRKGIYDGVSIATFALGTEALHAWLDGQPDVRFLPVHLVNDPSVVARNRNMLSIVGAEDFVSGASFSEGGHSIVCLPSTATVEGKTISRIAAEFGAGAIVTTPRHQVDVIVTEYGAAELKGITVRQRAAALADIAHPDFRDDLRAHAAKL